MDNGKTNHTGFCPLVRSALHIWWIFIVLGLSACFEHAFGMDQQSNIGKWGEFLRQTSAVKRLVYSRPSSFYQNGKLLKGRLTFDLAMQDQTFYWRNLTNFPGHPKNYPMARMVVGLSPRTEADELWSEGNQYWCIEWRRPQGLVSIAPRQVPPGKEKVSDAETWGPLAERDLANVRSFGMIGLVPKSFAWIDERHFKARVFSREWPVDTATPELTGEIARLDESSRPVVLNVTCQEYLRTPPHQMRVLYTYADREPRWFPSEITTSAPDGRDESTMKILSVELGEADLPPQGYTPSMFLPDFKTSAQPMIYFVSNGVQHVLTPTGPVAIHRQEPPRVSRVGVAVLGGTFARRRAFPGGDLCSSAPCQDQAVKVTNTIEPNV